MGEISLGLLKKKLEEEQLRSSRLEQQLMSLLEERRDLIQQLNGNKPIQVRNGI